MPNQPRPLGDGAIVALVLVSVSTATDLEETPELPSTQSHAVIKV